MSTHPVGAALEVFGRLSFLPQREIEDRVLATIYMESDLRLADMTHPSVIGRFGLTAEVSTGEETTTYSRTQKSIDRDFGKATGGEGPTGPWSEWLEESTAATTPIPHDVIDELRDTYGFTIIGGGYSL